MTIKLVTFLPLFAALLAGLGQHMLGRLLAKTLTTGALIIAAILSWVIFLGFLSGETQPYIINVLDWVRSGDLVFNWSLRVDSLTAVMLVVITTISAFVHIYSWGYMADDPAQPRFFAYLSFFTFTMLMLVTADNLVQMFFGWEGVGLASYLLIGFWYHKPKANAAAIKAFIANRVGDFGFMLGMFGLYLLFGTLSISEILSQASTYAGASVGFLGLQFDAITLLSLLLFVGAMGKSAQLGLHVWLPDAMEGPTPVSALIHAATMVTAGVFMLCRMSPLFEQSAFALDFVTIIGAATALFAASVALVQNDIKRVIAYSTCSQLGYMFFAIGVGAYGAAMFHLFTHAFFKALLFLGAGSVIHSMHHEQDMRYYGGLRQYIPVTFWMMLLGTFAITGVGVIGVAGFAGFYSKDAIIEAAFAAGTTNGQLAFIAGVVAALMTSFYSWRLMFLTFWGRPRWTQSEYIQHAIHDGHYGTHGQGHDDIHADGHDHSSIAQSDNPTGGYQPHESPLVMLLPLILLSVGAVFAGFAFHGPFIDAVVGAGFWNGAIVFVPEFMEALHHVPLWVKLSSTIAMGLGFFIAYFLYLHGRDRPQRMAQTFHPLYTFFYNKWYFDELYHLIFVRPSFVIGRLLWRRGDVGIIDRFGPDGAARLVQQGTLLSKRLQDGYLYNYALIMILGMAILLSWIVFGGLG